MATGRRVDGVKPGFTALERTGSGVPWRSGWLGAPDREAGGSGVPWVRFPGTRCPAATHDLPVSCRSPGLASGVGGAGGAGGPRVIGIGVAADKCQRAVLPWERDQSGRDIAG